MEKVCALFGFGLALVLSLGLGVINGAPQVPCFFIFGDSLVDNGNNNRLSSLAKANYMPYGIDFPNGPTGRFSNGRTTVDVISKLLNFLINDYLNNYFMPLFYSTGRRFSPEQYADVLIQQYTQQLQVRILHSSLRIRIAFVIKYCLCFGAELEISIDVDFQALYDYGARKFVLIGLGQIRCSPNELAQNSRDSRTCVERINAANRIFNSKLKALVDQFNNNDSDAKFIYIDVYGIFQDITTNPSAFGFRVKNAGCCGVGRNNGQITCLPLQRPCRNRNEYLFWDAFHPTEAANVIIGRRSYSAQSPSDAYPIDIRRLAQL
ncbi:GDSL esterase/lipase [Hibiscus syriacus]|uniref:GDSL esterase/lipase n=1 Tax=Hibiscus syriacus TaxID=106335 RepID=A0A6A3C6A8_HIBSY|nr:GDSL esterase/lipase [Hibiscus syriacus]